MGDERLRDVGHVADDTVSGPDAEVGEHPSGAGASRVARFCTNAGAVGLYALIAPGFPSAMRAGGTGFATEVGRGCAALGPVIAGFIFGSTIIRAAATR